MVYNLSAEHSKILQSICWRSSKEELREKSKLFSDGWGTSINWTTPKLRFSTQEKHTSLSYLQTLWLMVMDHPETAEAALLHGKLIHLFGITEEQSCQKIEARTWSNLLRLEKSFGQNQTAFSPMFPSLEEVSQIRWKGDSGSSVGNNEGTKLRIQFSKLLWALLWLPGPSHNVFSVNPATVTTSQLDLQMTDWSWCHYE